jgi:CxxC motif-containing protein
MISLICIICPVGCDLSVENDAVMGNACPRGAVYALEEARAPKRVVTATCALAEEPPEKSRNLPAVRRVPVKTLSPCPKEQIADLLSDLYRLRVALPVKIGDPVITDWRGTGITVAVSRTLP